MFTQGREIVNYYYFEISVETNVFLLFKNNVYCRRLIFQYVETTSGIETFFKHIFICISVTIMSLNVTI